MKTLLTHKQGDSILTWVVVIKYFMFMLMVAVFASCSSETSKTRLVKETFKEVKGIKYHNWQYQRYNNGIKYDSMIYHVENDKKVFTHSVSIYQDGMQM